MSLRETAKRVETIMRRAAQEHCGGGHEWPCAVRGIEQPCSACLAWIAVEQWHHDIRDAERAARAAIGAAYVDA